MRTKRETTESKTVPATFRMNRRLHARLASFAKSSGTSMTFLVEAALDQSMRTWSKDGLLLRPGKAVAK